MFGGWFFYRWHLLHFRKDAVIDPASAIGLGSGAGGLLGLIFRIVNQLGENKLRAQEEANRHAEANNQQAQEYRLSLQKNAQIDKGEPYSWSLLWGLITASGTRPDRIMPPPYTFELRMLVSAYCWAIFVCFYCADITIFSRAIDGNPTSFGLLYGIIKYESPDRVIYLQTLGGIGAALLTTASFVITTAIVGFARRS